MRVRDGVRPNKFTTVFFHAATVFMMLVFLAFMIASFFASERVGEPWAAIGALSLLGFILCCMIYSTGNLIDRRRAKRKAAR